ncbi:MAG: hypothetical protein KY457_09755, partial [Actinobacteria bacterium]|nr:hypothetical protein [Actinomycetota bacterium]
DGEHCVAANTGSGTVSFVSYATGTEVARVPTGAGPKHLETGAVPAGVLAAWAAVEDAAGDDVDGEHGAPAPDDRPDGLPATGGGLAGVGLALVGSAAAATRRRGQSPATGCA